MFPLNLISGIVGLILGMSFRDQKR